MKIVWKVLNVVLTLAIVLLIAAGAAMAISSKRSADRIPTLLGHKVLTVLSGSMEPTIHTGDLIFVKPVSLDAQLQEKDVITFRAKPDSEMLITHRIVGIIAVNGKAQAYVTKGDANDTQDLTTVARDMVIGVYRSRIPYFGYVLSFIRRPIGVVLCVILPGLVLIAQEFRKMWKALAEEEAAKKARSEQSKAG